MTNKVAYDIYLNSPVLGIVHAADLVISETNNAPKTIGFRYKAAYLKMEGSFPLDPNLFPLTPDTHQLNCAFGLPGILDDYLPDTWGRRVLTQAAFYRQKLRLHSTSAIQILQLMGDNHIGSMLIVEKGISPNYGDGSDISALTRAEAASFEIETPKGTFEKNPEDIGLLYLAHSGSGVGGARPKALVKDTKPYLAKFNRTSTDQYNNARVELACIKMAQAAGVNIFDGEVVEGINGREVLLLNRFDVTETGSRHHLITANALLKHPKTLSDISGHFQYDDVANLVRQLSIDLTNDLEQLLRQMFFNAAINNIDDHEKNFSFMHDGEGYRLSPAYDIVPAISRGEYHAAGFRYTPFPPLPTKTDSLGKVFGLSKPAVKKIGDEVVAAIQDWAKYASESGVSKKDTALVQEYLKV